MYVHLSPRNLLAHIVAQVDEQRVVLLKQPRSQPVEVHKLAILVLVELELRGQRRDVHIIVSIDTRMQVGQPHLQLHVTLLVVSRQEVNVGERMAVGHVETLEVGFLHLQDVAFVNGVAVSVVMTDDILHLVCVTRRLAFLVELEDVKVLVVPVIDPVAELNALVGVGGLPYVHLYHFALSRYVDEEIAAGG